MRTMVNGVSPLRDKNNASDATRPTSIVACCAGRGAMLDLVCDACVVGCYPKPRSFVATYVHLGCANQHLEGMNRYLFAYETKAPGDEVEVRTCSPHLNDSW